MCIIICTVIQVLCVVCCTVYIIYLVYIYILYISLYTLLLYIYIYIYIYIYVPVLLLIAAPRGPSIYNISVFDIKPAFCGYRQNQKAATCLATYVCIARYHTCVHGRYVRYVYQPSGAGPYLSIWLAAPGGAADIYVSLYFGPI